MGDLVARQAEQFAVEMRRRRQQRGWTLDVAAGRLGVSRRLLAQLEAGQANPSLSTLLSIAEGFDISLVELLSIEDKPSVTVQRDNASAPALWTGSHGGTGRLLVGSNPLERPPPRVAHVEVEGGWVRAVMHVHHVDAEDRLVVRMRRKVVDRELENAGGNVE